MGEPSQGPAAAAAEAATPERSAHAPAALPIAGSEGAAIGSPHARGPVGEPSQGPAAARAEAATPERSARAPAALPIAGSEGAAIGSPHARGPVGEPSQGPAAAPPEPAPGPRPPASLAELLDSELRGLVGMRERWDELVGHLGMLLRMLGLHKDMGFASFSHYCAERLGLAGRTVEQRIWLERRFYWLPKLRAAMREGRLSYEKARLVAKVATHETSDEWIARAEGLTCIALRREIERDEERAQMCGRRELGLRMPRRVRFLLDAALRSVRMGSSRWLEPGRCVGIIAQHFIDTWKDAVPKRRSRQQRVIERDGGFCTAPGCSRSAKQVHHIRFRSRGGTDDEGNLTSMCAAHHLLGVHGGFIRVEGEAPHALRWEPVKKASGERE